jgi:hypothetical protein
MRMRKPSTLTNECGNPGYIPGGHGGEALIRLRLSGRRGSRSTSFQAKLQGDTAPFRFALHRKDGTSVVVNVQDTPMYNASGEFKGIVGTFTVSS